MADPYINQAVATIIKTAEGEGGNRREGCVKVRVEPLPRGAEVEIIATIAGDKIPAEFITSLKGGMEEPLQGLLEGPVRRARMVELRITLLDGSFNGKVSSNFGYRNAGNEAVKHALLNAKPAFLECIKEVQITTPNGFVGAIIADLKTHHGKEPTTTTHGSEQTIITVHIPSTKMEGFCVALRTTTKGRASYTEKYLKYIVEETQ